MSLSSTLRSKSAQKNWLGTGGMATHFSFKVPRKARNGETDIVPNISVVNNLQETLCGRLAFWN